MLWVAVLFLAFWRTPRCQKAPTTPSVVYGGHQLLIFSLAALGIRALWFSFKTHFISVLRCPDMGGHGAKHRSSCLAAFERSL